MNKRLTPEQLTGRDETHLVELAEGHRLCPAAAMPFAALQADARAAGFELAIASSFRSFSRQMAIFNGKARCQRTVHDDAGQAIDMSLLSPREQLAAILRFSALPGTSRHHWGTDLDIYDRAAMPANYQLQLTPEEVAPGGLFDPMHCWLDEKMAEGKSHGFFRPYAQDYGGVAIERWHLSYAPVAQTLERELDAELLTACWGDELALSDVVNADLEAILARYVRVPQGWCPST
jgi:LAS superfamily LD-carboxypeptidase LdcB